MNKNRQGFTLIESLVAISILMIAIASPMMIAQKGLSDAIISENEMTASFLAQDGVETVKNIRDNTALTGTIGQDWLSELSDCTGAGVYCNIDTIISPVKIYPSTDPKVNPMKTVRDANGNFLYFSLGILNPPYVEQNSIFSRYINIVKSTNPDEAEVNVKVSWNEPSGPQSITISDFIYNYSANL